MRDPGFAPAGPETRREHPHPGDYSSRSDQLTHGQHEGVAKYIYVFVALCVLTGCSFFTQSPYWPFHATPRVGWAFMIAVSCTKALLVILFFMHVKYEAGWKYALTLPAGFMAVFLTLMLVPDIGMRNRWASSESRYYTANPPGDAEHSSSSDATQRGRADVAPGAAQKELVPQAAAPQAAAPQAAP